MWILGPMVISGTDFTFRTKQFKRSISKNQAEFIQKSIAILIFTASVFYAWQNTYYDAGSRANKVLSIKHPKMACIYTSKKRANVVNELISRGFAEIVDRKYLLAFADIPMINYLAEKEPFISTSCPKLYYSSEVFEKKLNEAIEKRKILPAITKQKQNTGNEDWQKNITNHVT